MSTLSTIKAAIDADIPVLLKGAPGTGKTALLVSLAEKTGAHLEVLIGSTMDPTDLGWPMERDGHVTRDAPEEFRRVAETIGKGQPAWVFFDELTSVPPSVQAALLRVVNERRVGGLSIRGARIIGAMNPAEQAAGGYDLPPPAANRWMHLDWMPDPTLWVDGMLGGWGAAQTPELAASRGLVASYIRRNPSALLDVPKEAAAQATAWPSPRTWDHLARFLSVLGASPTQAAQSEEGAAAADGLVGRHAGSEWLRWLSEVDLADPEDYLSGRTKLPERGDRMAAALDSIVVASLRDTPERPARIGKAVAMMAKVRADVGIIAAASLVKAMPQSLYKLLPEETLVTIQKKLQKVRA